MELVDSRRAVNRGDLVGTSSVLSSGLTDCVFDRSSSITVGVWVDTRGVFVEAEDWGRSVNDLTEAEDLDTGLEEVSGASSNISL